MPEPEPENYIAQIPVCISVIPRDGQKVKATGMSKLDIAWETGSLSDTRGLQKIGICDLTGEYFNIREFDRVPAWGLMLGPGMEVPTTNRIEHGQEVIRMPMSAVFDFRVMDRKGLPRFVIASYSHYLVFQPMGLKTMPMARKNAKLVQSCHEHYETLKMNSPTGPRIDANYSDEFVKRMTIYFEGLERVGSIWRRRGYLLPFCPWHRRTGAFNPNTRKFTCTKCGRELGGAGEPPKPVVDED